MNGYSMKMCDDGSGALEDAIFGLTWVLLFLVLMIAGFVNSNVVG
jgi:hypothetical protein